MKQALAFLIGLALWGLIIGMFSCGSGGNTKPPVVTPPVWSLRLVLPVSQLQREAVWYDDLWQVIPILEQAGAKPKPLVIQIKDGVACCYQKAFVLSARQGNTGSMWFYPLALGPEPHYGDRGAMNHAGCLNGLSWELAHMFGCLSGEDTCNDNVYRTQKWADVDKKIGALVCQLPQVTF